MGTRRRPPADMAAVKRSRSCFAGAITRATDKIKAIKSDDPAEVRLINTKDLDRLFISIEKTEAGFLQTLEDAQDFAPEGDGEEAFQIEEDNAMDSFSSSISVIRDRADHLLTLKGVWTSLGDLSCDIKTLEDLMSTEPEGNHSDGILTIETTLSQLRKEWRKASLPPEHPLKGELEACSSTFARLRLQAATSRSRTEPTSLDSSISSTHRPEREGGKLPPIALPTFKGDIMEWATFWQKFTDAVDKKDHLSDTTKLTYLRQAVQDPVVQTMLNSPTEGPDTYKQLVQALHKRYERTKKIHRDLVSRIMQMPEAKNNSTDLRKLVDDATSYVGSIKQTGHFTLETFLTSIIYSRLPYKLKLDWDDHHTKEKVVAPYTELLEFVSNRAYSLADNQPAASRVETPEKKNPRANDKRPNHHPKKANVHVVTPAPIYKWECAFCKPEKHPLYICPKWQSFNVQQRLNHVQQKKLCGNCLAVGHSTESCRSHFKCRECQQSHHTTLHQSSTPPTPVQSVVSSQVPDALMMTAQVLLTGPRGEKTQARVLIDPGAGISLVSSKIAQQLSLPLTKTNLQFSGVQGTPCKSAKHLTELCLSPLQGNQAVHVKAAVVPVVTNDIPSQEIAPVDDLPHLTGLGLADPTFHLPGRVDILLGADVYPQIMKKNQMITGPVADPAAQETIFGWAIVGPVRSKGSYVQPVPACFALVQTPDQSLAEQFHQYWLSEQPEAPPRSISWTEEQVQLHYSANVSYSESSCRYQVALPWKEEVPPLGDSRAQAFSRYVANERSILRRGIYDQFQEVVAGYLTLNHAELVPASEPLPQKYYYLPMHCVAKQGSTSTKLRVMFDGSAVSSSGISLNNSLMVGPTLHPSLAMILLKFRSYPVAITADIAKMYREVKLATPDKDVHRFLWRSSTQLDVQDYRMTRVTFGVAASPYLAVRTLQQTAADHGADYPEAVHHIYHSFYVDDLLAGASTEEEAKKLYNSLREILQRGGFNLCKWRSSSPAVLNSIPTELQEKLPIKEVTSSHNRKLWDLSGILLLTA